MGTDLVFCLCDCGMGSWKQTTRSDPDPSAVSLGAAMPWAWACFSHGGSSTCLFSVDRDGTFLSWMDKVISEGQSK